MLILCLPFCHIAIHLGGIISKHSACMFCFETVKTICTADNANVTYNSDNYIPAFNYIRGLGGGGVRLSNESQTFTPQPRTPTSPGVNS